MDNLSTNRCILPIFYLYKFPLQKINQKKQRDAFCKKSLFVSKFNNFLNKNLVKVRICHLSGYLAPGGCLQNAKYNIFLSDN